MKKVSLLMFPLILASLAGCNGGGNNNTGKVVINFWHTFGQKPEAALKSKIADFVKKVKDKEGVDVEVVLSYQGGYKDMPSKVTTGIATGESPTIAVAYPDHVADYLALEGSEAGKYVVNFDKYLKDFALFLKNEIIKNDFT